MQRIGFVRRERARGSRWTRSLLGVMLGVACTVAAHAADQFTSPTAEELAMTSVPGYPGAPAVVLYSEEIDRDESHSVQHYERIKVLTEEGKKYANVEIRFVSFFDAEVDAGNSRTVESIVGRTIHSDGTIVPFTGKPYLKTVEKSGDVKFQEIVFTLPDVQVGSIVEYRYADRSENFYEAPRWYLQGDLYVKSAHYTWYPTTGEIHRDDGKTINGISWFPILPPGAKIEHHEMASGSSDSNGGIPRQMYDLVVKDVPPATHEEFMPPLASYTYRVLFSFTPYRSAQEYWTVEGKNWSKHMDSFMNGGGSLKEATAKVIAGATTDGEKVEKIYAAVMGLENTEYSRQREQREEKAAGLRKVSNVNDVLGHQRGTPTQITALFIAMARAAGMKAYMGLVPDRSERLFTQAWMNIDQLDDAIAIVTVGDKEIAFDPGERYCAIGHLAWQHTLVRGLRQTDKGTDFFATAGDPQTVNRSTRVANLKLDAKGEVNGKIDLTFYGAPALRWRQTALRGDDESTRHALRTTLEGMVPKSMEVKVTAIDGLTDYEKPLAVHYEVSGTMGTPTGKRVMLPVDLFQANSPATFPHEKRELPVDFHYQQAVQDAIRVNVDPTLTIEALPDGSKADLPNRAVYSMSLEKGTNFFVSRRNYVLGTVLVMPAEYEQLRTFYSQFEAKDQESVVLKPAPASAAAAPVTDPVTAPATPGSGS